MSVVKKTEMETLWTTLLSYGNVCKFNSQEEFVPFLFEKKKKITFLDHPTVFFCNNYKLADYSESQQSHF